MEYTKEEVKILLENYPQWGASYCSKLLNRNSEAVGCKARSLGLKCQNTFRHPSLCQNFDYSIIESPTKEFAYMLGFLWADGYIVNKIDKNGSQHNRIVCEIASDDFNEIFNEFSSFTKWSIHKRKRKVSWKETSIATINNKYFYDFLYSLGFRKKINGFDKVFSFLKHDLFNWFILGLFDGDGHLNKNKVVEFSGPIDQNWSVLEKLLLENSISFGIYLYTHPIKGHSRSTLKIQNKLGINWFVERFLAPNKDFGLRRKR